MREVLSSSTERITMIPYESRLISSIVMIVTVTTITTIAASPPLPPAVPRSETTSRATGCKERSMAFGVRPPVAKRARIRAR